MYMHVYPCKYNKILLVNWTKCCSSYTVRIGFRDDLDRKLQAQELARIMDER
jgi:hypothetical protein